MSLRIPIFNTATIQQALTRRTNIVWAGFAAAAAITSSLLVLGDANGPKPLAMASVVVGASDASILPREAKLDHQRWTSIVIHHSSTPAGDAASVARLQGADSFHRAAGHRPGDRHHAGSGCFAQAAGAGVPLGGGLRAGGHRLAAGCGGGHRDPVPSQCAAACRHHPRGRKPGE